MRGRGPFTPAAPNLRAATSCFLSLRSTGNLWTTSPRFSAVSCGDHTERPIGALSHNSDCSTGDMRTLRESLLACRRGSRCDDSRKRSTHWKSSGASLSRIVAAPRLTVDAAMNGRKSTLDTTRTVGNTAGPVFGTKRGRGEPLSRQDDPRLAALVLLRLIHRLNGLQRLLVRLGSDSTRFEVVGEGDPDFGDVCCLQGRIQPDRLV